MKPLVAALALMLAGCASWDMYPRELTQPSPNKVSERPASLKGLYRVSWVEGHVYEIRQAWDGKLVVLNTSACVAP